MKNLFFAIAFLFVLSCEDKALQSNEFPKHKFFKDIPGITHEEIAAIEALQKKHKSFNYGMTLSTETFLTKNEEIGGYSGLLCQWLESLFGVPFKPVIHDRNSLLSGLENGEIDFTGDLTISDERKKKYFMSGTIAERSLKAFKIEGVPSIADVAKSRTPRLVFMQGFASFDNVKRVAGYAFEPVFANDYEEAYNAIKSGEADAFLNTNITEPNFDIYSDVVFETFYPLVFASAALATQNPDLKPIISVVQKALENGEAPYLAKLYALGNHDYIKNKFLKRLTAEELDYVQRNKVVKVATESDYYPISFYNKSDNKLQGIAFDVMKEIEFITGISFEIVNVLGTNYRELIKMVESGEASMLTVMMRSKEREKDFLLPKTSVMKDYSILISKSEFPKVQFNELSNVKVGIVKGTMQAELFKQWFPNDENFKEYDSMNSVFSALEHGEVDMIMAMSNYLLSITNYKELAGYKANVVFNNNFDITFGLSKNEAVLYSIIDKALALIDMEAISGDWLRKTFDYRAKVAEGRLPWIVGAAILSLVTLALILTLFFRSRAKNINRQNFLMNTVNAAAVILLEAEAGDDLNAINRSMEMVCQNVNVDRILLWKNILKEDGLYFKRLYLWARPEYAMGNDSPEYPYEQAMPAWKDLLFEGKNINGPLDTLPGYDPESISIYALQSVLIVPLFLKGEYWGFVSFDDCRNRRFFPKTDEHILRSWGLLVVGAIQRSKIMNDLECAVAEAETANRAKSSFLASMSHEIRTPMNAILGITEIQLQNANLPAETKNSLNIIYNSGYTLLGIINDLLDLSKIEAGKLELINSRYETASLINDTINLNTTRIGSKPIEFKLQVSENLPYDLIGDELRVKQVLNNLLSNAFKYTDSGEVNLSFSAMAGDKGTPDVTLVITVRDTGHGMTKEQVQSLFDAYSRFNMKANHFIEGTGLGMNIVQNLVKKMGGDIFVSSELGKGTEVTVHLTQNYASTEKLGNELVESLVAFRSESMSKIKKVQIVREYMPYGKVLVVDDMETNLYVTKGFLLPYGLEIDTALSGMEAIEKIERGNKYDIVFMDHMMPVMDGIEAAKAIRANGYAHPIVALTANAVAGQAEMFIANGFDGFISKPIDIRELNASLNKFVRSKQSQIDPELAKLFVRDAEKAMDTLQTYKNDDLQMYIISTHALKSALASIGETKLSDFARELEIAGKSRNIDFISKETPTFMNELMEIVNKLKPSNAENAAGEVSGEDMEHLRKMLQAIKEACASYNVSAATAALKELKQKSWPSPYGELMDTISAHLLHSDFDEAGAVCEI